MTDAPVSNRADREVTKRVDLPCRCPGIPHSGDSAQVVTLLGYGDRGKCRQTARLSGIEAFYQHLLLVGVVSWTFTLADGRARPVNAEEIALLDEGTVMALVEGLDEALRDEPVPKAPRRRSPRGTRAITSTLTPPAQTSSITH